MHTNLAEGASQLQVLQRVKGCLPEDRCHEDCEEHVLDAMLDLEECETNEKTANNV